MNGKGKATIFGLLSFAVSLSATEGYQPTPNINNLGHAKRPFQQRPVSLGVSMDTLARADARAESLDWSFLDGVYLITCPNADAGGERLERAKTILEGVGLLEKLQVKEFETDDENRIRGCYTSHISVLSNVLQSAQSKGQKNLFDGFLGTLIPKASLAVSERRQERDLNVLILEDNLALSSGQLKQGLIDSVGKYITTNPDWDMIHLSYNPYVPDLKLTNTDSKDIVKLSCGVGSALGTTAYIINTKAITKLLKEDESNGFYAPIPDVMAKLFPETRYATNPTIFVRAPNTKSLVNPQLDDLRSFLFQPAVAGFSQQLLILTGLTTNLLLPLVVFALMVASGASLKSTFDSLWMVWSTGQLDGPIILPLLSGAFALFSLGIIAKGAMLAPKPDKE